MKFNDFKKGLSEHSIRAYTSDLLQVFHIKDKCTVIGPKLGAPELDNYNISKNVKILMPYEEAHDLMDNAFRRWAKLSVKSRKRKVSSLRSFQAWLLTEEGIELGSPFDDHLKIPQKIPNFLSVDECLAIALYIDKQNPSKKLEQQKLLFYSLYGCGLRVSEACGLRWDHISTSQRQLRVMGKGGKERVAVIPEKVAHILEKTHKEGPYLFGEKPLSTRTAYQRIRDLGAAAGLIKPIHPHALRHSYATHLLGSGSDIRILQQLLGHTSLAATELYTHLDVDHLARSLESHHPLSKK